MKRSVCRVKIWQDIPRRSQYITRLLIKLVFAHKLKPMILCALAFTSIHYSNLCYNKLQINSHLQCLFDTISLTFYRTLSTSLDNVNVSLHRLRTYTALGSCRRVLLEVETTCIVDDAWKSTTLSTFVTKDTLSEKEVSEKKWKYAKYLVKFIHILGQNIMDWHKRK